MVNWEQQLTSISDTREQHNQVQTWFSINNQDIRANIYIECSMFCRVWSQITHNLISYIIIEKKRQEHINLWNILSFWSWRFMFTCVHIHKMFCPFIEQIHQMWKILILLTLFSLKNKQQATIPSAFHYDVIINQA